MHRCPRMSQIHFFTAIENTAWGRPSARETHRSRIVRQPAHESFPNDLSSRRDRIRGIRSRRSFAEDPTGHVRQTDRMAERGLRTEARGVQPPFSKCTAKPSENPGRCSVCSRSDRLLLFSASPPCFGPTANWPSRAGRPIRVNRAPSASILTFERRVAGAAGILSCANVLIAAQHPRRSIATERGTGSGRVRLGHLGAACDHQVAAREVGSRKSQRRTRIVGTAASEKVLRDREPSM
jgi:hypothetical protein